MVRKMDEKGYGSAIAAAVVMLVLLISISMLTGVLENSYDKVKASQAEKNQQTANATQTDIKIENATYYSSENYLETITKNIGSTVLETSKIDLLVEGEPIEEENIENKIVSGDSNTSVWLPEENLTLITENIFPEKPTRIKIVAEYGISDYTEKIAPG